jgi:tRNA 2-selenouridine synthase
MDPQRKIWVEDESISIGKRLIPKPFWNQMQTALLFDLQVPLDQRIRALTQEYGSLDKEFLIECTDRIRKRLGLEQTKHAIAAIRDDRMEEFVWYVLVYYDKAYHIGLSRRESRIFAVPLKNGDPLQNAGLLLNYARTVPEFSATQILND